VTKHRLFFSFWLLVMLVLAVGGQPRARAELVSVVPDNALVTVTEPAKAGDTGQGSITFTITNTSKATPITITAINPGFKVGKNSQYQKFNTGDVADAVSATSLAALAAPLPITLNKNGDKYTFKINFDYQDLVHDGNIDSGLWDISAIISYTTPGFTTPIRVRAKAQVEVEDPKPEQVPEPSGLVLGVLGLLGALGYRRWRQVA
jgi:hypothetical protein